VLTSVSAYMSGQALRPLRPSEALGILLLLALCQRLVCPSICLGRHRPTPAQSSKIHLHARNSESTRPWLTFWRLVLELRSLWTVHVMPTRSLSPADLLRHQIIRLLNHVHHYCEMISLLLPLLTSLCGLWFHTPSLPLTTCVVLRCALDMTHGVIQRPLRPEA